MRNVDWDKKLSREDIVWLRQSGLYGVEERIQENAERFRTEVPSEEIPPEPIISALDATATTGTPIEDPEEEDDYDDWKTAELKAEASNRKISGASKMNQEQLIEALRKYDREHPEG